MNLSTWLRFQGFADFTCFPGDVQIWEDKPLSQTGIRVEIAGDVASIVCTVLAVNLPCISVRDVRPLVEQYLLFLGRFKRA